MKTASGTTIIENGQLIDGTGKAPIRDAIVAYLSGRDAAKVGEIVEAVSAQLGQVVPPSSVRSSLNLNVGTDGMLFERVQYGRYRLKKAK